MAEAEKREEQGPTLYANIVTSMLNVDELIMELRRIDTPHRQIMGEQTVLVPPPTFQDVMRQQPIARVVMTFSAAKALKEYLDSTFPRVAEARKTGKPL